MSSPPDHNRLQAELRRIAGVARLFVATDFDGTVSPIVDVPADAKIDPQAHAALLALAGIPNTTVAVISGRSLQRLRELTDLPANVHLVGSHGVEYDATFAAELNPVQLANRNELRRVSAQLSSRFPGIEIEHKPASTALHYRHVASAHKPAAIAAITAAIAALPKAHVTTGKQVIEVAVIETSKGMALERLREDCAADSVVFIGDDVTDEHAFEVLREGDLGVKVGAGPTRASERVADVAQVAAVLLELADVRREHLN